MNGGSAMVDVSLLSGGSGGRTAVRGISLSVPAGQVVGLLGPNGAGKSTTMRMMSGFLRPTGGSVLIDGIDIWKRPVEAKRCIGYMPENAPLYADMIVEDYLRYVALMHGQNADERIPLLCAECGLKEVMHKNISELSRGYKQRVGLAHALMNDPKILILDEPTSGLDPNQIEEVRNLIRKIGETRTVIISTHILSEVEMLCGRVIIISKGKIVADAPTKELRERYGHAEAVYVQIDGAGVDEVKSEIMRIADVESCVIAEGDKIEGSPDAVSFIVSARNGKEIRPEIFRLCAGKNWTVYELSLRKNSLEDIFHELTVENRPAGGSEAL